MSSEKYLGTKLHLRFQELASFLCQTDLSIPLGRVVVHVFAASRRVLGTFSRLTCTLRLKDAI